MSLMRTPIRSGSRLRARPWQGDPHVAHVTPAADLLGPLSTDDVRRGLDSLRRAGYRGAITAALPRADQAPFLEVGFVETERLHLLLHGFDQIVPAPVPPGSRSAGAGAASTTRCSRSTTPPSPRSGASTTSASPRPSPPPPTSTSRWPARRAASSATRCAGGPGRGGTCSGWPSTPAARAWEWGRRCWPTACAGCGAGAPATRSVNTQEGNDRSLRLYQRAGFVLQPHGLAVMEISLGVTE